MSTMKEIETAISVLEKGGMPRKKITVMHCNTEYPTPMIDVNLLAMRTIGEVFDIAVGYSDHTEGVEVSIAAVALGACTIEKHLTLDRNLPGPDHKASIEPQQFEIMVNSIRNIENALGNTTKQPSPSELQNIMICRRSIVAASPIKAGEEFTSKNIIAKRPGNGLSPMLWDDVIGKKASRNFDTDELIDI
jgi:N,N'-diacetyllegionaminate synthase